MPFSIIASDMTVIGDLETEGVVRIEGRIRGTVRVGSQVLVAQGAGHRGRPAHPGGGHRRARSAEPSTPASGWSSRRPPWSSGDILTPRISIIEGGRVTGEVKMDTQTEARPAGTSHNS